MVRHCYCQGQEMSSDAEHIAVTIATELASAHSSYYLDKKPKTVRSYFRKQRHESWGLAAHCGARLQLDRRCLVGAFNNPRDRTSRNCPRDEYDEATAYDSHMNTELGFRAGPGDSHDAA